ncbi:N-acetyl-gamma-glutamyl-phosphate reductase [Nitrosococcus oceani]|uniref:N-acetyl-gamma-glutamyl-phosphate reductase n=1 Tax=Nitrosococcus oceani TaxID=1229 RepID=UPI0004E86B20|nr:N-acetyl-gamma-glutamyl-phosphate reductase [Nitrosococcus oceani]KFI23226.1 N-acetyl-gamma-glutamyl-phosphate reductase [Nitrosococcus oceani]
MIRAGIVGGTGYTGVELLRLLANHPNVEIVAITSRTEAGRPVSKLFPNLRGYLDICFTEPEPAQLAAECDVVFFATPHGVAMDMVPALLAQNTRVIDLSADFRLADPTIWEQWYGRPHAAPHLLAEAVYGLPEINREAIRQARLIACPGCYPTAVQLGFLPLLEHQLVDPSRLIADAKSGASGAGRKAALGTLLCEAGENFKAYSVSGHRHLPEIIQGLQWASRSSVDLTFVPHLIPMIRGIHATLYAQLEHEVDLQELYEQRYAPEPFVDVLPPGSHPETRSVRGNNMCRLAIHRPSAGNTVIVLSVTDNLIKGASGQAIQNMNLMFGQEETRGLTHIAVIP